MAQTKWKKQCSICRYRLKDLKRHLNVAHSGGKHRCKKCPCAFHTHSGLEQHIRLKHYGGKRNEYLASRSVIRPMKMPDHSQVSASKLCKRAAISRLNSKATPSSFAPKSNGPKLFAQLGSRKSKKSSSKEAIRVICEDCGNTILKNHLHDHLQSLHRGGRFACNLCPCSGFTVAALTNHKRRHYENNTQPIPTYLTQLKQQESSVDRCLKISSARRSISVEILDDPAQQASTSREGSSSPEILTTFGYEESSLDSNRTVSIEPDASCETPKMSLNMETQVKSKSRPAATVALTNQRPMISQVVAQTTAHHQHLTSSSATKKLEPPTSFLMRASVCSTLTSAATGKNLDDFHTKVKGNVTDFAEQDSGINCERDSRVEPTLNTDFNGNLPEKNSWDIRPSTGMQFQLQPSFPTCHECNTMFASPGALANHMKTHVAVCGYCGKTVPTLDIAGHMPGCLSSTSVGS